MVPGLFAFPAETPRESVGDTTKINEVYAPGFAFSESHVDRDQRVIHNVSLLGQISQNNRTYSSTAMREAADAHRGVGIFLDHPTKTEERERGGVRSVRDLAGRVTNARFEGDRVRGDIQVLEGLEGDKILALAEQMPGVAGFSHRATGKIRRGDDGDVVESIDAVHGADVVTDPATVSGLFESIETKRNDNTAKESTMDLSELTLSTLRDERPDLIEQVREGLEDEDTLETLREENRELKQRLDTLEAEKAEREHRALVEAKLADADLPERVLTDTFREQLHEAPDEDAIDRLIADRKELVESFRRTTPKSVERDIEIEDNEDGPAPIDEAIVASAADELFV